MAFAKLAYSAALAALLAACATQALAQEASGFTNVNASETADFSLSGTDFDISGSANADASASANFDTSGSANIDASGSVQVAQQTYVDVIANLEAAGYTVVETKRTLLGRIRIVASNGEHLREVVVSRATGEVKSDEIVEVFPDAAGGAAGLDANGVLGATGNAAVNATGNAGLGLGTGGLGTGLGAGGSASAGGSATGGTGAGGLGGSVSGGVSGSVSGTVGGLLGN